MVVVQNEQDERHLVEEHLLADLGVEEMGPTLRLADEPLDQVSLEMSDLWRYPGPR